MRKFIFLLCLIPGLANAECYPSAAGAVGANAQTMPCVSIQGYVNGNGNSQAVTGANYTGLTIVTVGTTDYTVVWQ